MRKLQMDLSGFFSFVQNFYVCRRALVNNQYLYLFPKNGTAARECYIGGAKNEETS